jgi:hypothetical protein
MVQVRRTITPHHVVRGEVACEHGWRRFRWAIRRRSTRRSPPRGGIWRAGRLPDGIPATGFLMMVDRDAGKLVEVLLFESEEDLRQGDATMGSYAPGEGSMHRVSVERFDVPVRL